MISILNKCVDNNIPIYLFLKEKEDSPIYSIDEIEEQSGLIGSLNKKVVKCITAKRMNEQIFGLIEFNDELIGWVEIKNSMILQQIPPIDVKVSIEKFKVVPLNKTIDKKKDYLLNFSTGIFKARHVYIDDEGKKVYGLYKKNRFSGFVYEDNLNFGIQVNEGLQLNQITSNDCFKDSDLTSQYQIFKDFDNKEVFLKTYFPSLEIIQFKFDNKIYWISIEQLKKFTNIEEVLSTVVFDTQTINPNESHLMGVLSEEQLTSKQIIQKLLKENIILNKKLEQVDKRKERVQELYDNLSNSKLGRIQRRIWSRRK